jgi:hypothetical protein
MYQMKVDIRPEEGGQEDDDDDDKQKMDNLNSSLLDDLLNLDVWDLHLFIRKPQPGSKSLDAIAVGSRVVDFSSRATREIIQTVQPWVPRENSSITNEMTSSQKIDVKGISAKDHSKIADAWIIRQTKKMTWKYG